MVNVHNTGYGGSSYYLDEFVEYLQDYGIMDILLPFLLIFVIFYAVLYNIRIFGERERKSVSLVVALCVAGTAVALHVMDAYPNNFDVIEVMNYAIPQIAIFFVAVLSLYLILGLFGGSGSKMRKFTDYFSLGYIVLMAIIYINSVYPEISIWVPIISVVGVSIAASRRSGDRNERDGIAMGLLGGISTVAFSLTLYIFGYHVGWFREIPWWLEDETTLVVLIIFSIIGIVIGMVTSSESDYGGKSSGWK